MKHLVIGLLIIICCAGCIATVEPVYYDPPVVIVPRADLYYGWYYPRYHHFGYYRPHYHHHR